MRVTVKNFYCIFCKFKIIQRLKQKFCLCRSIDCYNTDPGGQVTCHNSRKIAFSLWRKWITTVVWNSEDWKNFCENLTNRITFSLFKCAHQTRTRKRKRNLIVKEKHILLSQLHFNCNIEKTKIKLFYANIVSLAYSKTFLQRTSFITDTSLQPTLFSGTHEMTLKLS